MAERVDEPRIERAPTVLSRRLVAGIMLFTPSMTEVLRISSPGEVIWALLGRVDTVSDLVNELSQLYQVPTDLIRPDIEPIIDALIDGEALRVIDERDPGLRARGGEQRG